MRTAHELLSKQELMALAVHRRTGAFPPGDWESVFKGAGYEFWGLREMVRADAFREIDWKATARSGRHQVREHLADSPFDLMILYDVSGSTAFGRKSLLQANIAAALAWTAAVTGNRCGLVLYADKVEDYLPPRPGRGHLQQVISAVAGAEPRPGRTTDLSGALALLTSRLHRSLTFVLSDFMPPVEIRHAFHRTPGRAQSHEVYAVRVLEACEKALPPGSTGIARLYDLETGERTLLDLGRWRAYNERAERWHRDLKRRMAAAGIPLVRVTPEDDCALVISRLVRNSRRGLRGG